MITKIHRQNVLAILAQDNHPKRKDLDAIIKAYEGGKKIDSLISAWAGGGTTGAAIAEYVEANCEQKKTSKRKTAASKEVE